MNKEWEDRYLKVREENHKLKEKQKEQAALFERLQARLITLKEQQDKIKQSKVSPADVLPNQGRLFALKEQLDALVAENARLAARLRELRPKAVYETPRSRQTSSPRNALHAPSPDLDLRPLELEAEELKRKLLETNAEIRELEEQKANSELYSSLVDYKSGSVSALTQEWKDYEDLKREVRDKRAQHVLAKNKFETIEKEYKEYLQQHKKLSSQAEETQQQILELQRQQRKLEAEIKQLKLQKDQDDDLKHILEDMKQEELVLDSVPVSFFMKFSLCAGARSFIGRESAAQARPPQWPIRRCKVISTGSIYFGKIIFGIG
jgi:hypothetical protein